MKLKQLLEAQGQRSVRPTFVIAEFDFIYTRSESFDHSADLAALQAKVSDVFQQCNHR